MNAATKYTALLAFSTTLVSGSAQANLFKPSWSFADVSVNYLDWSAGTEKRNNGGKEDFVFLEVEGGVGYSWGEFYGFYDLENPGNDREDEDGKEERVAAKATSHIYLGSTPFSLYGQVYHFNSKGFYETNTVLGLGYRFNSDSGFWIKPWIGMHYVDSDTGYSGSNGVMAGWVAGYPFQAMGQNFMVTNWTELEMNRASEYEAGNGDFGINGALALWWNATANISAGLQYRYAHEKLGFDGYNNATITTLKYTF